MSAFHCELRAVERGRSSCKDLGSTNGTFLGPVRVREAVVSTLAELTVGRSRVAIEPQAKRRVDVRLLRIASVLSSARQPEDATRLRGAREGRQRRRSRCSSWARRGRVRSSSPRRSTTRASAKTGRSSSSTAGASRRRWPRAFSSGTRRGRSRAPTERRKGALAEADGGTLFLDELGELPVELQPKLLRALSEKQVKRVGGNAFEPIDVRVLAATRRDLGAEMNAGRFRSDLFFRIAQVRVELPPLRERWWTCRCSSRTCAGRVGSAPSTCETVLAWIEQRMASHDWPGNVRELVNVACVAATLADEPGAIDDVLTLARDEPAADARIADRARAAPASATRSGRRSPRSSASTSRALARRCKGNVSEMARQSGMERHHVRAYLAEVRDRQDRRLTRNEAQARAAERWSGLRRPRASRRGTMTSSTVARKSARASRPEQSSRAAPSGGGHAWSGRCASSWRSRCSKATPR